MPADEALTFSRNDPAFRDLRALIAERTTPIVVWVGAGLSVAAGVPTWTGLRQAVTEDGLAKAETLNAEDSSALTDRLKAIAAESDLWVAFERLKADLGQESFQRSIRRALSVAATAPIPKAYEMLWGLPIRGVLTLNIDRLVYRSFSAVNAGELVNEYNGPEIARLRQLLFGSNKFVGNMHGNFEDSESWIFTKTDVDKLLKNSAYTEFLRTVLSTCVNLFLGMSVDDIAVGGQLSHLAGKDVSAPPRFWFSDRSDVVLDDWAERRGTRVIRYRPEPSHEAAVLDFLRELVKAEPEPEISPVPIRPSIAPQQSSVFPPENFDSLGIPELREVLNARAAQLLEVEGEAGRRAYEEFCEIYDEQIHKAWYVSVREGRNILLGYTLLERVARGAFGQVYRAIGPDGKDVAVKLLLQEVHEDPDLLRSFRQGVTSMQILKKYDISSMVAYEAAYEIPAFVVMDWVEGPNLDELSKARQVNKWAVLLKIAHDLAQVIRTAHSLPERVLHRDIRPANVMLRNYWTDPDGWELVVLDFDLSWHRGLEQKSVYFSTAIGYLAPEQIDERSDSTRNAAVDSFGVGMTLLFLLTGRDPLPEQHKHADFVASVGRATAYFDDSVSWLSLPRRFSRLIVSATRDRQADRADMSEVLGELNALQKCLVGDVSSIPVEYLTEELASRVAVFAGYTPAEGRVAFSSLGMSGVSFTLQADEPKGRIVLIVEWSRTGVEQRANLGKYVEQGARATCEGLNSQGWTIDKRQHSGQSLEVVATVDASLVRANLTQVAAGMERALGSLRFGA